MNVRLATSRDVGAIAALHAASWREAYRGALSEAFLAGDVLADRRAVWTTRFQSPQPGQFVAVADADGEVVGFACAFAAADPDWGTLLDNLHVRSDVQRRAIGVQLMHRVASWCDEVGSHRALYLWVLANNLRAQRFYQKLGAVDSGRSTWVAPDGSTPSTLRYSWSDVRDLLLRCENAVRARTLSQDAS